MPGRRWVLYIIKCGDGTLYTGITNDVARRVMQHNNGSASRYTRSRLLVKLVYQEPCRSRSQALKKEFAVKALSRKEKEEYIKKGRFCHKGTKTQRRPINKVSS